MEIRHSLKAVARQTGLSPYLIRAWERRYKAITPGRSHSKRRYYTDDDINRLILLKKATRLGESIGSIANLNNDDLKRIISEIAFAGDRSPAADYTPKSNLTAGDYFSQVLDCIRRLEFDAFEKKLMEASVALSIPSLLNQIVSPTLNAVGEMWLNGELRIADEHRISVIIRSFLGSLLRPDNQPLGTRCLVSTTPARQLHELGALMASLTASASGWRTVYLGPNLPPEEIAGSVNTHNASVLALSIIYPMDDPYLGSELVHLRRLIGDDVRVLIGGRAAANYLRFIEEISGIYINSLDGLRRHLEDGFNRKSNERNNNE